MNTILAIFNAGGRGKSTTILNLANLLMSTYPSHTIVYCSKNPAALTIDFRLIININGKIVALESQGDPGTNLEIRLEDIVAKYQPNLIVCSTRTRGETVHAVDNIATRNKLETIWTSTYQIARQRSLVNNLKANHILDLVVTLGII